MVGKNELEESMLETLRSSDFADLPGELVDAASGLPIVGTLKKLSGGIVTVRDHLFRAKVLALVSQIADLTAEERRSNLDRLLSTPADRIRFSQQLLLSLERLDDVRKATILGNLATGLIAGRVSLLEFWRMSRAVEAISLDEEWPIIQVIEEYKGTHYPAGQHRDEWRHEGVLLQLVNERLGLNLSDGNLRSIVIRLNQTGLFGCLGWRQGPAHDCELAPWYFTLKDFMSW